MNKVLGCMFLLVSASVLLSANAAIADSLVSKVELQSADGSTLEKLVASAPGNGPVLTISSNQKTMFSFRVTTLEKPPLTEPRYAVTGYIKYSGTDSATGYLELWNHFGNKGSFFSRTLGGGLLAPISGSSEWRKFALPFYSETAENPAGLRPERLELNAVLPPNTTISFTALELRQYSISVDPIADLSGGWLSPAGANSTLGALGAVLGIWGALIGFLSWTGRWQSVVLGSLRAMILLGAVFLVIGGVAYGAEQPAYLYSPLALVGLIVLSVSVSTYIKSAKGYAAAEERKMMAQDMRI